MVGNDSFGIVVYLVISACLESTIHRMPIHKGSEVGLIHLTSPTDTVASVNEVSIAIHTLVFGKI